MTAERRESATETIAAFLGRPEGDFASSWSTSASRSLPEGHAETRRGIRIVCSTRQNVRELVKLGVPRRTNS